MDPQIEKLLKSIAEKLIDKEASGWFTKLVLALVIGIGLWYLKSRLDAKSKELADARIQLENERLNAQRADFLSSMEASEAERKKMEDYVRIHLMAVEATDVKLRVEEEAHRANQAKYAALVNKDWDAINEVAGVK
jgi:HAMP domain-containing protein